MADVSVPNIDYGSAFQGLPAPGLQFLQGVQGGFAVQQGLLQQQALQAKQLRTQEMQRAAAEVAKNPTTDGIAQLSIAFPELSEQFKRSYDMMAPQQQKADLQHMTGVYAALHNKRPDIAAQQLRDRATALKNSGASPMLVQAAESMAKLAEMHPELLQTMGGTMLASVLGDKFGETFKALGEGQTAADSMPAKVEEAGAKAREAVTTAANAPAKQAADIANTEATTVKAKAEADKARAEITNMAAQRSLDADRLMTETQLKLKELGLKATTLDDSAKKIVNDSTVAAVAADQSAGQLLGLADQFEQQGERWDGRNGSMKEAWDKFTGNQDSMTKARQEYVRLRNSQAVKMLPPGPASDKDIELALQGFPPETANAQYMGSFLRGMAKLQQREAVVESARSEWVNAVGHMGKPKTDIEIDGVKVPAGSSFIDFTRQFVDKKSEQRAAAQALEKAQGRSYMRHATPQAGGATGTY